MPAPGEEGDPKNMPTGPSVSLLLHQEFAAFRGTILGDIKGLLQAALQEVLDQHEVLLRNQEHTIRGHLDDHKGAIKDHLDDHVSLLSEKMASAAGPAPEDELWPAADKTGDVVGEVIATQAGGYMGAGSPYVFQSSPRKAAAIVSTTPLARRRTQSAYKKGDRPLDLPQAHTHPSGSTAHKVRAHATGTSNQFAFHGNRHRKAFKEHIDFEQDHYDVSNFYATWGFCQRIARSSAFHKLTLLVIFVNVVWLYVDAEHNTADSLDNVDAIYVVFQNLFCFYYLAEFLIRLGAFAVKSQWTKDPWMKFDALLVVIAIFDTWIIPAFAAILQVEKFNFRMVHFLRILRIVRLMRTMPESVTILKGLYGASRGVLSAFLMIFCLIYSSGFVMNAFLWDIDEVSKYWARLSDSMLTLLLNGVFLDGLGTIVRQLVDLEEWFPLFILFFFLIITTMLVMNVLVGVLVEAVHQITQAEKDLSARVQIRETLLQKLREIDNGSGDITKDDLVAVITDPDSLLILHDLEVDIPYFLELQDMLYDSPDSAISISQIMNMILDCRGDRPTTMQDLVHGHAFSGWALRMQLQNQSDVLKEYMERMVEGLMMYLQQPIAASEEGNVSQQLWGWMTNKS
jgi:hypothetical protein